MQNTSETLQQRLLVLQNAAADLSVAKKSIDSLNEVKSGDHILVPSGGGTFVNAHLGDLSSILVNVGADVSIEMDLEYSRQLLILAVAAYGTRIPVS